MFRGSMDTTTPSTTTITTTQLSLLERIMPKFLNPFGLGTTSEPPPTGPPLFPFFTKAMFVFVKMLVKVNSRTQDNNHCTLTVVTFPPGTAKKAGTRKSTYSANGPAFWSNSQIFHLLPYHLFPRLRRRQLKMAAHKLTLAVQALIVL